MKQPRAALVQAVNRVVNATSPEERAEAAAGVTASLETFLASDEFINAAPSTEAVADHTRRQLGEDRVPVSGFTDQELRELNQLLPWAAMTVDQQGRVLGAPWSAAKRAAVHGLVEGRLLDFDKVHPLRGKRVAEFGCFEGIHTLGLLLLGAEVTAIDGRVENALKTMARVWAYGRRCDVLLWDFEREPPPQLPAAWDVLHHVGVLYHLSNPVEHLDEILPRTREAVLLDTHVATDEREANDRYTVGGREFRYRRKLEPHAETAPFAGMRDHAKYLLLEDLTDVIRGHGFADTRVISDRMERNGRRVTLWAFK